MAPGLATTCPSGNLGVRRCGFGATMTILVQANYELVGDKAEVESRIVLEEQTALHAVATTNDDHARCGKTDDLEVSCQFLRVPHLTVTSLQLLPSIRFGV